MLNKESNVGHFGDESKITEKKILVSTTRTPEDITIKYLRCIRSVVKKSTISFVVSPCQFARLFYTGKFYYNSVQKIEIGLISDKNIRQFTATLYCYLQEHRYMQGRTCDGGVFLHSAFYNALTSGALNVPQRSVLLGNDTLVPYVLVADGAFPLTSYLIKPYAGEVPKGSPKRMFNYRLS